MKYGPTITDEIISFLFSGRSMYRQKQILWQRVRDRLKSSRQNYNQAIYRLAKNGYLEKQVDGYKLLPKAKSYCKNYHQLIYEKPKNDKNVLVIFDIVESKKKTREWLRFQLKWWNFKMIQRSVWLGNGPLPKDFKKRLKDLGVDKSVIVFGIRSEKIKIK